MHSNAKHVSRAGRRACFCRSADHVVHAKPGGLLPCSCTARGGWRSAHARMWWCWRREPRSQSTWWRRASSLRRRAGSAAVASSGARASGPAPCRRSAALRSPTPHSRRGVRDGCVLLTRTSALRFGPCLVGRCSLMASSSPTTPLPYHRWQRTVSTTAVGTLCSQHPASRTRVRKALL